MTDYPFATDLLLALLEINDTDAQLPLEVLVNLHRTQLRAPLQRLAERKRVQEPSAKTEREWLDVALEIEAALQVEYPRVKFEFTHGRYLWSMMGKAQHYLDNTYNLPEVKALYRQDPLVWALLYSSTGEPFESGYWTVYAPVAALYPLTWGPAYYAAFLPILEEMLSEGPETRRMILEIAGLEEAARVSPIWDDVNEPLPVATSRRYDLGIVIELLLAVGEGLGAVVRRLRRGP
jgi:hypothetical protein